MRDFLPAMSKMPPENLQTGSQLVGAFAKRSDFHGAEASHLRVDSQEEPAPFWLLGSETVPHAQPSQTRSACGGVLLRSPLRPAGSGPRGWQSVHLCDPPAPAGRVLASREPFPRHGFGRLPVSLHKSIIRVVRAARAQAPKVVARAPVPATPPVPPTPAGHWSTNIARPGSAALGLDWALQGAHGDVIAERIHYLEDDFLPPLRRIDLDRSVALIQRHTHVHSR